MGKPVQKVEPSVLVKPQGPVPPAGSALLNSFAANLKSREANLGRRRVPRRTFDSPVGLLLHGAYEIERSYQVGEGGMMISSRRSMTAGQLIAVSFYLPSTAMIVVRGVVRSIIPADQGLPERYGLEFLNLNFQFKREIRNFVASATGFESV